MNLLSPLVYAEMKLNSSNLVCQIFICMSYCTPLCILFIKYLNFADLFIEISSKLGNSECYGKNYQLAKWCFMITVPRDKGQN